MTRVTTFPDVSGLIPAQRTAREIEYRAWPRDPRYLAGDDGSIIGPSGRVLRQGRDKNGRMYISMRKGPRATHRNSGAMSSHVLIAEAWHGLRPAGKEVAHGNGDPSDNRPGNLRWATHVENTADKYLHGTHHLYGERAPWATLTERQVQAIKTAYSTGQHTQRALAKRFGINPTTVSDIVQGRRWAHTDPADPPPWGDLHSNAGERNHRARLTEDDVRAIRAAAEAGATATELARQYGLTRPGMDSVVRRKTWRHVA